MQASCWTYFTIITVTVYLLLSCLVQTVSLFHLHLFSVGRILLGKWHSVYSHVVTVVT